MFLYLLTAGEVHAVTYLSTPVDRLQELEDSKNEIKSSGLTISAFTL